MSSKVGARGVSRGGDAILVAIRMRPLDSGGSRAWRLLPKEDNSVAQCTHALVDRVPGINFFAYDKTFGENSTTREVYDGTSHGIVEGVLGGMNGTIFAYGMTSSGKTYTMQGPGTIENGSEGEEGIAHMAASDIFDHIVKEEKRQFVVRVAYIEIYNEEVRDLLVSGDSSNDATLTIREDPRRGFFVNSKETIVDSKDELLAEFRNGEKNRSVGSTAMNERSSRSHTIFRITVESRSKDDEGEDRAVRVSTLNLVDLAGSESVRHTGATGDRQKESGKINQSLLTLSLVIDSLGQNAEHVKFRDSKLTRLLQSSLSGNAKMAVICCVNPSSLYLEETRSTLQFASRAKLVKTRAQVNEVMDDRSMIKKLRRELKEARNGKEGEVDAKLLREALSSIAKLTAKVNEEEKKAAAAEKKLSQELAEKEVLQLKKDELESKVSSLELEMEAQVSELIEAKSGKENVDTDALVAYLTAKDDKIEALEVRNANEKVAPRRRRSYCWRQRSWPNRGRRRLKSPRPDFST